MSVVGWMNSSSEVRALSAPRMSPSAHFERTRRVMSLPELVPGEEVCRFGISTTFVSISATCFLMMEAAVWRWPLDALTGARMARKANDMKRSHAAELGSDIAFSTSLDRQLANEARTAFGILLITQFRRNSSSRSERVTEGVGVGASLPFPDITLLDVVE